MSRRSNRGSELEALGLPGEPGSLLELAVTHRSFAFEQPEPIPHNERLEFLGDSVLNLIVTDHIFLNHPDLAEGELARLRASVVNEGVLAVVARELGLGDYLRLGKGEEASGGRDKESLLADAFEAMVGAAYLERGLARVADVLSPVFAERIRAVVEAGGGHDAKGALQERVARERGLRPSYRVSASGPDHDKRFTAHVYIDEELFGEGSGRSKRAAELKAAGAALARMDTQEEAKRSA